MSVAISTNVVIFPVREYTKEEHVVPDGTLKPVFCFSTDMKSLRDKELKIKNLHDLQNLREKINPQKIKKSFRIF